MAVVYLGDRQLHLARGVELGDGVGGLVEVEGGVSRHGVRHWVREL